LADQPIHGITRKEIMVTALSAFLRKTPGEALREYFDRPEIGLPTEFDWSVPGAELSRPLLGAIEKMSRVQRDRISNDAERVQHRSQRPRPADPLEGRVLAGDPDRSRWPRSARRQAYPRRMGAPPRPAPALRLSPPGPEPAGGRPGPDQHPRS